MATAMKASSGNRPLEAALKLMEMTQKGELKWQFGEPKESMKLEAEDRIDPIYVTEYSGRHLEIYRRTWPVYREAGGMMGYSGMPDFERRLQEQIVLRLATPEGGFWTFPQNRALQDLMTAVSFQVTDARGFLDEILSEG